MHFRLAPNTEPDTVVWLACEEPEIDHDSRRLQVDRVIDGNEVGKVGNPVETLLLGAVVVALVFYAEGSS